MGMTLAMLEIGRRMTSPRGGLRRILRPPFDLVVLALRKSVALDRRIRRRYFAAHALPKLQVGAGLHPLPGWLNTDVLPLRRDVLYLNAARPFPFADESFDRIFSEHVIEHLTLAAGERMLAECFRSLRPGGTIRISTPDLLFLTGLLGANRSPIGQAFVDWEIETYVPDQAWAGPVAVFNNSVRAWGHRFIYDAPTLEGALRRAGFAEVRRCEAGESPDPQLRGLENVDRAPPGLIAASSLILEAVRPGG
jgi:predicted SAM-dependent methyltransferase